MSFGVMKRTNSCTLLEASPVNKKIELASNQDDDDDYVNSGITSLTSSELISDETECESESCSSASSSSEDLTKNHVRFCDSVSMRVVYYMDEDDGEDDDQVEEEESVDSVVGLKKEDNSKPIVEQIQFDAEEEAIRSQLVGCICATRRKKHNYAAMYGCGQSLGGDDCDDESEDDIDDFDEFKEPARVIVACDPSEAWFSF